MNAKYFIGRSGEHKYIGFACHNCSRIRPSLGHKTIDVKDFLVECFHCGMILCPLDYPPLFKRRYSFILFKDDVKSAKEKELYISMRGGHCFLERKKQ